MLPCQLLEKKKKNCVARLPGKLEIRTGFNFGHVYMSKIKNTGLTDKWHTCYIATATQNLKDFHNSSLWTCSPIIDMSRSENNFFFFLMIFGLIVSLK